MWVKSDAPMGTRRKFRRIPAGPNSWLISVLRAAAESLRSISHAAVSVIAPPNPWTR